MNDRLRVKYLAIAPFNPSAVSKQDLNCTKNSKNKRLASHILFNISMGWFKTCHFKRKKLRNAVIKKPVQPGVSTYQNGFRRQVFKEAVEPYGIVFTVHTSKEKITESVTKRSLPKSFDSMTSKATLRTPICIVLYTCTPKL